MRSAYNASKYSTVLVCLASVTIGLVTVRARSMQAPAQITTYVTVADKGGKPVPGLTADDFKIMVGEAEAKIDAVRPASDPVSLAVILAVDQNQTLLVQDALSSITKALRQIPGSREGLTRWEDNKVPFDDVGPKTDPLVNTFSRRFPNPVEVLPGIMGSAAALGEEPNQRRDILVIARVETENVMTLTPTQVSGFLESLHKNKATLWTMTINSSSEGGRGNDLMAQAAKRSGGGVMEILKGALLSPTAKDILSLVNGEYAVTYEVSSASANTLQVAVRRPGVSILAPIWAY